MLPKHASLPSRRLLVHQHLRTYSSSAVYRRLKLAYDLHEPPKDAGPKNAPIVFIHGLFGSKKNNRSMTHLDIQDLRNHGDSPHDPRHDYTVLAEDVEGFIDEHKLENSTLIGHSMGAKTAMVVALRQRKPIANLISVDNAPIDAALKSDFAKYARGMRAIEDANVTKQSDADAILQSYEPTLATRQFLLTNLICAPDGTRKFRIPIKYIANALDDMADFPFRDPDEVRFEKPTLFVRGTKSPYIADETLPIIGRFFPRFELTDVDSGHWVISEKPAEFKRAVVEFLQDKQ
ncbi:hypothetical protein LTR66_003934 [Elasticomyces elasticus]|nr:hypothetical protein LTR50_004600 [Elasticomyces elasticus]KAK4996470.1 hypothetical protein LTR66_003934 [Elasticomyces elasticus]